MNRADGSTVPVAWATLDSNPFRDPKSTCLPCVPNITTEAPCAACPNKPTLATRMIERDSGPPCCATETYSYAPGWPWEWGGEATPSPSLSPALWQDLYAVKQQMHPYSPIFNPTVL